MEEKRRAKRMEIDVQVKLKAITEGKKETAPVEVFVTNISKKGMAFECGQELMLNSYYDVTIQIWTKEKIDAVIQVVRRDENVYGSKFIGMSPADQMKIEIYELFNYPSEELIKNIK